MPRFSIVRLSLVCFGFFSPVIGRTQVDSILITYGFDREPPYFSYEVTPHGKKQLTSVLTAQSKYFEREFIEWKDDLLTLSRALIDDFARSAAMVEAVQPVEKEKRKKIAIVVRHAGLETCVSISGSDETLVAFTENSSVIREFFQRISRGKPKAYVLWETLGPGTQSIPFTDPRQKK